jgi:hypothetical protein
MGGGQKTTTTQNTAVPAWQNADWQQLISQVQGQVGSNPTSPVPVAQGVTAATQGANNFAQNNLPGINNQFSASSNDIANQHVNGQGLSDKLQSQDPFASYQTSSAISHPTVAPTSQWNTSQAQQYMSPYEQTSLAAQQQLANTQLNQEHSQIDSSAAGSGALGGDRSAVAHANLDNTFNQQQQAQQAAGMNTAYQTGQQAFQNNQALNSQNFNQAQSQYANSYDANAARQLQAASGEAGVNQQATEDLLSGNNSNVYADFAQGQNNSNQVNTNLSAFNGQSNLGQSAYGEQFNNAQYPMQQLQQEAGILSALPNQSTVTGTQQQTGGGLGQILGGIMTGASMIPGLHI